jgi:hypothetical protein
MPWIVRTLALLALTLWTTASVAQGPDDPSADIFTQGLVGPNLDAEMAAPAKTLATPQAYTPAPGLQSVPSGPDTSQSGGDPHHNLLLEARLVAGGPPLTEGLIWRIFGAQPAADGQLPLVSTAEGGTATLDLAPGDYLIHAAFGRAGATKRVTLANDNKTESLVLDAGGLELSSVIGDGRPIPPEQLTFEVQQQDETGELVTVVPNAAARQVLRLSAGTYHVISRYGSVNAVVRADIQVEAGKLTEAVMRHTGAEVTLKLVSTEGGEALANTSWTVTTEDGVTLNESVGAFPTLILAAGNYTAVAKHENQIYSRDFKVEAGLERDIEVRLADLVRPDATPSSIPPAAGGEPMEGPIDQPLQPPEEPVASSAGQPAPLDQQPIDEQSGSDDPQMQPASGDQPATGDEPMEP